MPKAEDLLISAYSDKSFNLHNKHQKQLEEEIVYFHCKIICYMQMEIWLIQT